jgi:hypothetical protein
MDQWLRPTQVRLGPSPNPPRKGEGAAKCNGITREGEGLSPERLVMALPAKFTTPLGGLERPIRTYGITTERATVPASIAS